MWPEPPAGIARWETCKDLVAEPQPWQHEDKTGVREGRFGPFCTMVPTLLLVRIYPDLGPLSCWLQKRSRTQFKKAL